MHRECRERFPRHRLQKKPQVSDPDMHHGTCVTHVPCCMSGSLTLVILGIWQEAHGELGKPSLLWRHEWITESHSDVITYPCSKYTSLGKDALLPRYLNIVAQQYNFVCHRLFVIIISYFFRVAIPLVVFDICLCSSDMLFVHWGDHMLTLDPESSHVAKYVVTGGIWRYRYDGDDIFGTMTNLEFQWVGC